MLAASIMLTKAVEDCKIRYETKSIFYLTLLKTFYDALGTFESSDVNVLQLTGMHLLLNWE